MDDMNTSGSVWVVESGEYENRSIDLIATTLQSAVESIKRIYQTPYVVEWGELVIEVHSAYIEGKFEAVIGYSVEHTCRFEITEHELWNVGKDRPKPILTTPSPDAT